MPSARSAHSRCVCVWLIQCLFVTFLSEMRTSALFRICVSCCTNFFGLQAEVSRRVITNEDLIKILPRKILIHSIALYPTLSGFHNVICWMLTPGSFLLYHRSTQPPLVTLFPARLPLV